MIKGKIENGLHPKVWVEVTGRNASQKFSALVDTGFDLDVALHHQETVALGLETTSFLWVRYASGARVKEPICRARVLWHGKWKAIKAVISNEAAWEIHRYLTLKKISYVSSAASPFRNGGSRVLPKMLI